MAEVGHVPGRYHHAARVGLGPELLDNLRNLVDVAAAAVGPASPLVAVYGAQLTVGIRPFIPNFHAVLLEVGDVGVALEKPQQFVDDTL